jgi:hypothetical protein
MSYQQTSLIALNAARRSLPQSQRRVYEVIKEYPGCDDQFVAQKLKLTINRITPRRNELAKMGYIRECGKRRNMFTGLPTMRWEVEEGRCG